MKYLITLFLFLAASASAFSQSPWLAPNESNLVQIEWQKPNFDLNLSPNERLSTLTSVLFISGKYRISEQFNLVAELPFSHWEFIDPDGIDQQDAHTTIGNIYVGSEFLFNDHSDKLDFAGELGLRLPTLPEPDFPDQRGAFTGFISSPDRREAFQDDFIPIYLNAKMLIEPESNIEILLRAGGLYSIYTGDFDTIDNEFYLLYSANITYRSSILDSSIGFTGRTDISDEQTLLGTSDTSSQLWVILEKRLNQWAPGLYLRTPLDEQNSGITYVVGAQAKIGF